MGGGKYCSAVIVAAGSGSRMKMDINKQFLEVGGAPVLAHTIKVFQNCSKINEVVVVINEKDLIYCKESIIEKFDLHKVKSLVIGGATRQESVFNGIRDVSPETEVISIHDGARPFIDNQCIVKGLEEAWSFGASCTAVPLKDTIKRGDEDQFAQETLERSFLWSIQTPQTFRCKLIQDAHRIAADEGFTGTDDAVLVERLGLPLKIIMGSYYNIKITTQEDIVFAGAIAKEMKLVTGE